MEKIPAYAVEARIYRDQASVTEPGKYIEVPLPEEVSNIEGAEEGEKSFYVDLVSEKELSYLRYTPEKENDRHYVKLKHKGGRDPEHAVSIPVEYALHNNRSPLQGISHGDRVNVELRVKENEFRVYDPEDFSHRVNQLSEEGVLAEFDTPIVAPLLLSQNDEYTDLSAETSYSSQKFKIVPFEGQHEVFIEAARQNKLKRLDEDDPFYDSKKERIEDSEVFNGSRGVFFTARDRFGIPVTRVDELAISWCPKDDHEQMTALLRDGFRTPEPPYPDIQDMVIYRESNTKCSKVVLPEKGSYYVIARKGDDVSYFPFYHQEEQADGGRQYREDWGVYLYSDDEMPPTIYVPIPRGRPHIKWTKYD